MQEADNVVIQLRFPQKLWYLLNLDTDVILWGGTGRTILLNYKILQNYLQCNHSIFKTTNISSFIRQLNLYGFRKVTSHLQDPLCNSSNPYMHEFIHDNFQYGRPELLSKITRKALTMKKSFKPKACTDYFIHKSPLQKARQALQLALQKAAQDLYATKTYKSDCKSRYEAADNCYDEEDLKWIISKNIDKDDSQELTHSDPIASVKADVTNDKYRDICNSFMDYSDDACQQNSNFHAQFLSMPDLDDPNRKTDGVDLLNEFNTDSQAGQGIKNLKEKPECNSLNCVLPSVSIEQIDDISVLEKNTEEINHYNNEWDQMFNDMMSNKSSYQGVSNLRELYSQISQTIDLLNS